MGSDLDKALAALWDAHKAILLAQKAVEQYHSQQERGSRLEGHRNHTFIESADMIVVAVRLGLNPQ